MENVPSPLKVLEEVPEKYGENDLKITKFSLAKLHVFDLGSTLDFQLDTRTIVEDMVHCQLALASSYPSLEPSIHGGEHFVAERAGGQVLKEQQEMMAEFEDLSSLLSACNRFDSDQTPEYVERQRSARALFWPIMIRFEPSSTFSVAQVMACIRNGGVCLNSYWVHLPDEDASVDRIIGLTEEARAIELEVALPSQLPETVGMGALDKLMEKVREEFPLQDIEMVEDLETKEHNSQLSDRLGTTYVCYRCSFASLSRVYQFLVRQLCRNYLKRVSGIRDMVMSDVIQTYYDVVLLHDLATEVENPFEEIVRKYPRQICGLATNDRDFRANAPPYVRSNVVDFSPETRTTSIVSTSAFLKLHSSEIWRKIIDSNSKRRTFVPAYEDIVDYCTIEIILCLYELLACYDMQLTRLLEEERTGLDRLMSTERKIAYGLEEMFSVRHAIHASIEDWWSLAENALGVQELSRATNSKLSVVRRLISAGYQQRLNKVVLLLTSISGVLSVINLGLLLGIPPIGSISLGVAALVAILLLAHRMGIVNIADWYKSMLRGLHDIGAESG